MQLWSHWFGLNLVSHGTRFQSSISISIQVQLLMTRSRVFQVRWPEPSQISSVVALLPLREALGPPRRSSWQPSPPTSTRSSCCTEPSEVSGRANSYISGVALEMNIRQSTLWISTWWVTTEFAVLKFSQGQQVLPAHPVLSDCNCQQQKFAAKCRNVSL